MTSSSNFFDVVLFLLSSLVTGPSFMSVSSLVLELWQFSFKRDWPEIRKSSLVTGTIFISVSSLVLELWQFSFKRDWPEIRKYPSEFCPISRDCGKLGIPNLAWLSLITFYWMLQNARGTAFTVSELLRENQQRGWGG